MRVSAIAIFFALLSVGYCFVAVQTIDDLESTLLVGLVLDGNCSGDCVDPDFPGGARSAAQIQAAPGEYIIPGSSYRSTNPAAPGRMDYRELFVSSSQANANGIEIQTVTENGFWKINFPTTTGATYTTILTYDGNSSPDDEFYYERDVLSLDLTRPGSFSNSDPASTPPAYGFFFLASSDLTSTFSFRVITDDFKGSQLTVTIPQGTQVEVFAPFYQFDPIPAGDSGPGGRGQHKQMTGAPADFSDVSVLSFIFETTKAVDAQLTFVSLITGTLNIRVFLDCTGDACAFDDSDTLLTGVTLTVTGNPSSTTPFTTQIATYQNVSLPGNRFSLTPEGYFTFYLDAGIYQICVGTLPNGVTLVNGCSTPSNRCFTSQSITDEYEDIFIDVPVTSTLSITPPAPTTVNCVQRATATSPAFTGTATATGCGIVPAPTFFDVTSTPCNGEAVITRTWTVIQSSQSRTATQTITVEDTGVPVIGIVSNRQVNCGDCTSTAANCLGTPIVTDDCAIGVITPSFTPNSVGNNCIRTFTRTWNAVDPCGNSALPVTQTFTVVDSDVPVFTGSEPLDRTVPCGGLFVFDTLFATDPCQSTATVSTSDQPSDIGCTVSVRRIFTASDGCSNIATRDQVLTSNAAGSPSLIDPPDIPNVSCTSQLSPTALSSTSTAVDSCTNAAIPGVTFDDVGNSFSNPPHQLGGSCSRSFQRIWSIDTECGGSSSVSQFITVVDDTIPFFTSFLTSPSAVQCPSNQCTCTGSAPVPVPGDLCSTPVLDSRDNAPVGNSCITTTTRVWTATDACGTRVTANQFFVREDQADPILSLPIPTVIYQCSGGFDRVNSPTFAETPNVVDCQPNVNVVPRTPVANVPATTACDAVYTRVWDANDGCGNTASISQTVIVRDSIAPTFASFPQNTVLDCSTAATATSPTGTNLPRATDACTNPSLDHDDETSGEFCPNGVILTRTWVATDDCGLSTSLQHVFTITNNNDPVITVSPPSITVDCNDPISPADLGSTATIAVNVCNIDTTITFFDTTDTTLCPVRVTRTFVARDTCGRSDTVTQIILLTDEDEPQFVSFPPNIEISCADSDDPDVDTGTPTIIDNCDTRPTLTSTVSIQAGTIGPGLCPGDDVTTRTWTATDRCGNFQSRDQIITVINRPPDECDPVECIPQPCDSSSCPVPNCDCCGAAAVNCLPVNCNPQPCNPVDCTPVPCSGCDIDIAVTGCQPRTCPPRYVYVDDDDVENFQKAQPAQANPKVSGASQLVLSCMLLLASVGSIFVALF